MFDGKSFFVTSGAGGLWLYLPETGGPPVVIESSPGISSLASDDQCLYWASIEGIFSRSTAVADSLGPLDGS